MILSSETMRKFIITLAGLFTLFFASAQAGVQFAGEICCNQELCPNEPIGIIDESSPVLPLDPNLSVEYAWFELVDDPNASGGNSWHLIPNSNTKNYQPLAISSSFGGFYMRAARQTGTLPYKFSNIITVKYLSPGEGSCVTAANEPSAQSRVSIAPNPASDFLKVNAVDADASIAALQVTSVSGSLMEQQTGLDNSEVVLNVYDYAPGIYFINLMYADGKKSIHKWVKL